MKTSLDVRRELGRLYSNVRLFQLGLTLLTGKALAHQVLPRNNAILNLSLSVIALLLGVGSAFVGTLLVSPVLVILGWIFSLYGMRYLQLVVVHNASHQNFVRNKVLDYRFGFWASMLLMIQNFEHYGPAHALGHHRWQSLSTDDDPTVQSLAEAGIKTGKSVNGLMLSLLVALFSPRYHIRMFWARIRSYYQGSSTQAKVMMTVFLAIQLGLLVLMGASLPLMLAWVLPVTVLYQQAALLRLVVEHHWDEKPDVRITRLDSFPLTVAVFLGAAPPQNSSLLAWVRWMLAMSAALLVRLVVLPGDSGAAHDWHHQHPRGDWPNYIAERRKQSDKNPSDYKEIWGYWKALKASFKSISQR